MSCALCCKAVTRRGVKHCQKDSTATLQYVWLGVLPSNLEGLSTTALLCCMQALQRINSSVSTADVKRHLAYMQKFGSV